jgi:hypothetical protein
MTEPCTILSLVAEPTECVGGYYNLDVTVTFSNPPGMENGDGTTGTLIISTNCGGGGTSPYVIPSPFPDLVVITETATINGLIANGVVCTLTAYFESSDPYAEPCEFSIPYEAPSPCLITWPYYVITPCCGEGTITVRPESKLDSIAPGTYLYTGPTTGPITNGQCYTIAEFFGPNDKFPDLDSYLDIPVIPPNSELYLTPALNCNDLEVCPACDPICYTVYSCDGLWFNTISDLDGYVGQFVSLLESGVPIDGTWYVMLNSGDCDPVVNEITVSEIAPADCECRCFEVIGTAKEIVYVDCNGQLQKTSGSAKFCAYTYPFVSGTAGEYIVVEGGVCDRNECPILCYELTECKTGETLTSQSQSLSEYFVTGEVLELVGYPGCWQVTSDAAEDCSCAVDLTVTIVHADCPTCLGITAYKLTNCENTSDIKYTYDDLSEYVGQTLRTDCGCYTVELIDFEPTSTSPIVIISSFNSCTECLRQYYKLTDCNGVEDPVYTYTDLSLIIPTPVIGCDCISVTYTLIGGEPVTVEVEKESTQLNGKNFYKFPLIENNISVVWDPIKLWIVVDDSEETQATLSLDTPCPFGTYTIEEFSIFESFEVAPCDSIPVIKIKGCDTCWNVEETNTPINPGIVTVTASFPDCPSCTPPLPCLCNRMTNYDTIQRRYTYTDCDDVENAFILQPGKSSGKICLKKWTVTWPETDNLEVFGDCVLNEDQVTYNCPETRPKRKITPGYSVPTCDIDKYEKITCRSAEIHYKEVMRLRYGMSNCCPEDDEKWLIKKELIDLAALVDPNYICTPVQTCGCAPSSCGCGCSSTLKTCNSQ